MHQPWRRHWWRALLRGGWGGGDGGEPGVSQEPRLAFRPPAAATVEGVTVMDVVPGLDGDHCCPTLGRAPYHQLPLLTYYVMFASDNGVCYFDPKPGISRC